MYFIIQTLFQQKIHKKTIKFNFYDNICKLICTSFKWMSIADINKFGQKVLTLKKTYHLFICFIPGLNIYSFLKNCNFRKIVFNYAYAKTFNQEKFHNISNSR